MKNDIKPIFFIFMFFVAISLSLSLSQSLFHFLSFKVYAILLHVLFLLSRIAVNQTYLIAFPRVLLVGNLKNSYRVSTSSVENKGSKCQVNTHLLPSITFNSNAHPTNPTPTAYHYLHLFFIYFLDLWWFETINNFTQNQRLIKFLMNLNSNYQNSFRK